MLQETGEGSGLKAAKFNGTIRNAMAWGCLVATVGDGLCGKGQQGQLCRPAFGPHSLQTSH